MKLDADFGHYIGMQIKKWIEPDFPKADFIASHGHTIFHEPTLGFTTQIGSGSHIAHQTGIDTITSFRAADIAAGGQGAPFAPAVDMALFPGYSCYLNLGGIANLTIRTSVGEWKAWDIGPCNQPLNYLATQAGLRYDADGRMAAQGKVLHHVMDQLRSMFPYQEGSPKGLSNAEVQSSWIQYLERSNETLPDLLATVTETIAQMILSHIAPLIQKTGKVFVTGGGAHNLYLMGRLQHLGRDFNLVFHLPSTQIVDYKECLLMAYLGYLTVLGRPYGLASVTGAIKDTVGGAIFKACP
jgi:anhydro-N-acetylmuramic acid kinase